MKTMTICLLFLILEIVEDEITEPELLELVATTLVVRLLLTVVSCEDVMEIVDESELVVVVVVDENDDEVEFKPNLAVVFVNREVELEDELPLELDVVVLELRGTTEIALEAKLVT